VDPDGCCTAAIAALVDDPTATRGKLLIAFGLVLAVIAVPLGAWSATKKSGWFTKRVQWRTVAAGIAFLIWSPAVPNSGWESIDTVAKHPKWTVVICAALAYVFAQIGAGIDNRIPAPK
jgi:hypothetical protein